jgi:hypothetical protein
MKRYTFNEIKEIQEFQFLTDSSGILLSYEGSLYKFIEGNLQLIATPSSFQISKVHFITEDYGAIIGNSNHSTLKEGSALQNKIVYNDLDGGMWLFMLVALAVFVSREWAKSKLMKQRINWGTGLVLLLSFAILSCSKNWQAYKTPDPTSKYSTITTKPIVHSSSMRHDYFANRKQKSFIAITKDGGKTWSTTEIPTSFYLTALTSLGNNFLVGSYANEKEGVLGLHGDGDIFIYGNDATFNSDLSNNNVAAPFRISSHRGINGFKVYMQDSLLFVYGTEVMPTVPKDEVSTTDGNIHQLPVSLKPSYKVIDVPDTVIVTSLSKSRSGDLWVTLDNKKPVVINRREVYHILDSKRLLRFKGGEWQPVHINEHKSFNQVEFLSPANVGYALTEDGDLFRTEDEGNTWSSTEIKGIQKMFSKDPVSP